MALILDILSWAAIVIGSVFTVIGAFGLLRLPDVYSRMHGGGIVETMGAGMILLGLMFQAGLTLITVKLIIILAFLFFTNPTTTHALARALVNADVKPLIGNDKGGNGGSEGGAPSKT